MESIRRAIVIAAVAICLAGCAPLTAELNQEMQRQISTEVAVQVATAVADLRVGLPPDTAVTESAYDCGPKYCKDMTVCEEAVYKLTVCDLSRLDGDGDGIPCESICSRSDVDPIVANQSGTSPPAASAQSAEEIGPVTRVVDGDTIDVLLKGVNTRIRYLQMNTPERNEPCSSEATQANADLVEGKTVRLVPDIELVDRYDRLLRFIYVDEVLVNRVLVEQGYAEVVLYPPNDAHYEEFVKLEQEAAAAGRGCHPTGIFNDGTTTR